MSLGRLGYRHIIGLKLCLNQFNAGNDIVLQHTVNKCYFGGCRNSERALL